MIKGAILGATLIWWSSLLPAQEASLFLGGTRATYVDTVSGAGGSLSLRLATSPGRAAARIEGAFSRFTDAGWALQVGGQGAVLWRPAGGVWAGVAMGAAFGDFEGGNASGTVALGPLVVVPGRRTLLTAGITGGAVRRLDSTWIAVGAGSLRGRLEPGAGAVTLEAGASGTVADTLRFADLSLAVRAAAPMMYGSVVLGVRAGDLSDGVWGSVEAGWTPLPRVAVELRAGRYPPDLTGFTEGLYGQAGIRFYAWGTARPAPAAARAPGARAEPRSDGTVQITVRLATRAREVAIAGDWNDWRPVPLAPDAGRWRGVLRLAPGLYRYAVLADGQWTLPDGAAAMDDGFGGKVGVLVVPAAGR